MRHVAFDRLHNFRDVGGYSTSEGRTVRWGRFYRSDGLGKLAGADWVKFQALGVRTVIDLRYSEEVARRGRVPDYDGLAYYNLSIEHRPCRQATVAPQVEPVRFLADRNAEVLADGAVEIGQALAVIAAAGSVPVVIHCAAGKDRTGLLAALVLALIDVSDDDIVADYALTELATAKFIADWEANPANPAITWPGYGLAPPDAMRLTLKELAATYGSVHDYARDRLAVDAALLAGLRATLLDP
ncbi:protein-tyrosine phosphatase [Asanoa hainanensis]|uniref:Protein-tyrosine phosphatase n=1 Tax=Asanoa hainanensis TaxID=560556 RepID=A0A239P6Y8_9ACTN|nr:tyrosine-protein phosphatase [Asanoa hainanensis]SNT62388.1 protein-tyrosine phosphatase [Asanoa hainanensis]